MNVKDVSSPIIVILCCSRPSTLLLRCFDIFIFQINVVVSTFLFCFLFNCFTIFVKLIKVWLKG